MVGLPVTEVLCVLLFLRWRHHMYDLLLQNFPVVTCFSRLPCYPAFLLHVKHLSIWQEFHYWNFSKKLEKPWGRSLKHSSLSPAHCATYRHKNIGDFLQAAKSGDVLAILEQGKREKRVGEKYEVSPRIDKGTEEQKQILYIMFWHQHTHLCQTSECLDCMLHLLSLHRADCYYVQFSFQWKLKYGGDQGICGDHLRNFFICQIFQNQCIMQAFIDWAKKACTCQVVAGYLKYGFASERRGLFFRLLCVTVLVHAKLT